MKIKLKVLRGGSVGKEVRLPTPKCLIGRSEECHMRPKSEAVSRRHCMIYVKGGHVFARDLKSRNGTYVNGDRLAEDRELQPGDELAVGPLAFEVVIDRTLGGEKKPKVNSIAEAAARTTTTSKDSVALNDSSISEWLEEADAQERQRRLSDPETRQLKLDETDQVKLQLAIEQRAKEVLEGKPDATPAPQAEDAEDETKEMPKKKGPAKLPQRQEAPAKDSREAAAIMLKKFFNKR